jgi:predicted Zn-dependent protease
LDAKMTLPHLGIAQMALAAEETTNAATELQAVLDLAPGNIDALRLLGQLIKDMPDRVERSLSLFREAAEKKQEDAELQELYAELASGIDPQGEGVGNEEETKVMQGARCEWQFHDM